MDIYSEMKKTEVKTSNWCSDLHVPVTEVTTEILNRKEFELHKKNATTFTSRINGELYYDIPFAYQNYHRH